MAQAVGSAPPQQFGQAITNSIQQVPQQQYYEHTQPGIGGTDAFGALQPQQRNGLAQALLGALQSQGLKQQQIQSGAGVNTLNPQQMCRSTWLHWIGGSGRSQRQRLPARAESQVDATHSSTQSGLKELEASGMGSGKSQNPRISGRQQADRRRNEAPRLRSEPAAQADATTREHETATIEGSAESTRRPALSSEAGRSDGRTTLELERERLHPRKVTHETGAIEVRKEVVSEERRIMVPVLREQVTIERVPPGQQSTDEASASPDAEAATDDVMTIPIREEEVVVERRPVVTEEISVRKQRRQRTMHITESVQREEARVEARGDAPVHNER